jgi:signal transduction histidine kinase
MGEVNTNPPKQLYRLLLYSALLMGTAILFGVGYFIHQQLEGEIRRLRELTNDHIHEISKQVVWRGLAELGNHSDTPRSLFPVRMETAPSPFKIQPQWRYRKAYTTHSYFCQSDVARTLDLVVGYSQAQLTDGREGDLYLNLLAWIRTPALATYNYDYLSRTDRDHLWLVYYSPDGSLAKILLSIEGNVNYQTQSGKIGGISGFYQSPSGDWQRDTTAKGTLYYEPDNEQYALSLRIRVKPAGGIDRPAIETAQRVGVEFVQVEGHGSQRREFTIPTYTLGNGVLTDVPHESGGTLKAALVEMSDNIQRVSVINLTSKASRILLDRNLPSPYYPQGDFIERVLWWVVSSHLDAAQPTDAALSVSHLTDRSISLLAEAAISLYGAGESDSTLRLVLSPPKSLVRLIDQDRTLVIWTLITLAVLTLLSSAHLWILKKIGLLTREVAAAEGATAPRFSQSHEKNEIGFLSRYVEKALETKRIQHEQLSRKNSELTDAYGQIGRTHRDIIRAVRIIGHDIKNPVSILNTIHRDFNNEEANKQLRRIALAGEAVVMIEEQYQAGYRCVPVDLRQFVAQYLEAVGTQAPNLTTAYTPGPPHALVDTNEEQLESIIDAIIENANDFARHVTFSLAAIDDSVQLLIENDGPQIAKQDLVKVFEYNFSTRSGEGLNAGLGLFGAQERAASIGAIISVENTTVGVMFRIGIPKHRQD